MYKRRFALTIGVADFTIFLPFTQQEYFAPRFRCNAEHARDMSLLHDQNQVRSIYRL
ncbi:hypothetical protein D3C81_2286540 [compost metagenome]